MFSENIDLHSAACRTKKRKLDQEQENPDDFREPSVEEDERISSALEYEFPDDTQDISDTSTHDTLGERKLILMDERSEFYRFKFFFLNLINTNTSLKKLQFAKKSMKYIQLLFSHQCLFLMTKLSAKPST